MTKPKANRQENAQGLPPTILTIFGATGDLSADYLLPALLRMSQQRMLPRDFKLVCVGRRDLDAKSYLKFIVDKSASLKTVPKADRDAFLKHLIYYRGDLEQPDSFAGLAKLLADRERPRHACYNRLFYFATRPQQFAAITRILKDSGLLLSCAKHGRQARVLVEKPFGFNLESARTLNQLLLKYFTEDQIYRIDHYAGKETVQNMMVVRFANSLFEPLWNNRFIDHVEISVLEKDGAENRIDFYDQAGAIKDFLQNHILQMLALLVMDEPYNLTPEQIRDQKVKVLKALRPLGDAELRRDLVKGQYQGYRRAAPESRTETYFALKTALDLPRWAGVPIYLRSGKRLSKKLTQVSVHFKEAARCLFNNCSANILTFRIQPDESVHLQINNKVPGFGVDLHQGDLAFGYEQAFAGKLPGAYERLLLDFIEGDQRLFIRSDEIEASWRFVDSITENPAYKDLPLYPYKPGSNGPAAADEFMARDLREWWTK